MTVSQLLTNTTTSTTKIKYKIIEHLSLKTDANTDATKSSFFNRLGFVDLQTFQMPIRLKIGTALQISTEGLVALRRSLTLFDVSTCQLYSRTVSKH